MSRLPNTGLKERGFLDELSYYCVIIDTSKGRIIFKLDHQKQDFAPVILRFLKKFAETRKPVTVVTPGLLQLQLGTWPMSITPGIALPARVIRGSLSVTAPTVGRACNLLLAREPARRIERLYVHVGWLLSGFEVMEELGEEDFLTQIYWSQLGDHQEEHREAES